MLIVWSATAYLAGARLTCSQSLVQDSSFLTILRGEFEWYYIEMYGDAQSQVGGLVTRRFVEERKSHRFKRHEEPDHLMTFHGR